jgi:tellurite resistance-related uncharacterized protein
LRRTDVFTETTIPPGLLRNHQTRDGVWGRIVVLEGALRYTVLEPTATETRLVPGRAGIVEPTVPHQVAPIGPVRFYVEFLRVQRENTSAT